MGTETKALQRHRGNAVVLATACIAIALWSMSCGGAGSAGVDPVPTAGFSLSSTTIDFANQVVGTSSAPLSATVSNVGDATLTFSRIQVTGPNGGDFTLTNDCGSSLAASAQCTLAVTFAPSAAGTRTATVAFTDNAASSSQTLTLTGKGTAPGASLSATSLTFGSQLVGTSSPVQTLTLTNDGNSALGITSLALTGANVGDFAEIADTCGSSVAAGGNCTIGVTFTPSAAGPRTATLSITDNASGSPQAANLSGTGSHDVILSWGGCAGSGVMGYNVYRGTVSGGESSTPLNSTPISGTTYVDENVTAGARYYYVVTSIGSNDAQSAPSNETEATVPTP